MTNEKDTIHTIAKGTCHQIGSIILISGYCEPHQEQDYSGKKTSC